MDLSLSVPSNPSLPFSVPPVLSSPLLCFLGEYLSDMSFGCLWWELFPQPYFYWASDTFDQTSVFSLLLLPHHHVYNPTLCTTDAHTHIQFAFSLFLKHVHASLSSACYIACYCHHSVFQRRKSVSVLPREWLIFPGFFSLPIYFSRVTLQLPSPSFPLRLCVLWSPVSPDFSSISFLFCSFLLYSYASMCGKNPALGLHCLFPVRTSGDIKGTLRGLSVCISPALTVCAQDPSMRLALHSIPSRLYLGW